MPRASAKRLSTCIFLLLLLDTAQLLLLTPDATQALFPFPGLTFMLPTSTLYMTCIVPLFDLNVQNSSILAPIICIKCLHNPFVLPAFYYLYAGLQTHSHAKILMAMSTSQFVKCAHATPMDLCIALEAQPRVHHDGRLCGQ